VRLGLKTLTLAVFVVCVLYNAIAHTAKYVLLTTPRFHHLRALEYLGDRVSAEDTLFFSDDRYSVLYLDRLQSTYAGSDQNRAYWILPYTVGSRDLEQQTVKDFTCFVAQKPEGPIVWMLSSGALRTLDAESGIATIDIVQSWGRLEIDFRVHEMLRQAYDSTFLRGRVETITYEREVAGQVTESRLFNTGQMPEFCESGNG